MLYYARTIVKPEFRILKPTGKEAAHALVPLVESGVRIAPRLRPDPDLPVDVPLPGGILHSQRSAGRHQHRARPGPCLLYTSDAADDLLCVDLGGRRIIKQNNKK